MKGGVTAAKGFAAASYGGRYQISGTGQDMAMIYSEVPCMAAGTFTTNLVKAAPVKWDQKIVKESRYGQAVVINSGIANACTGEEGMGYCEADRGGSGGAAGRSRNSRARGIHRRDRHAASDGAHLKQESRPWFRNCRGGTREQVHAAAQGDHDHGYHEKGDRGGGRAGRQDR